MKASCSIIITFAVLLAVYCFYPRIALSVSVEVQIQRVTRAQKKRRVRVQNSNKEDVKARDYSQFSHRSDKHKSLQCNACHKAPTPNWQSASGFPDISDYPSHDSCLRCHRSQFFRGARPPICSVCHVKVAPRSKDRFEFAKPRQPGQFNTIFPHDKHQDVIAGIRTSTRLFAAHAKRKKSPFDDQQSQSYNNCSICHVNEVGTPQPEGGFPDRFSPPEGTFKTAPVGHGSCFNCHWKGQPPLHASCAGCHELSKTDVPILVVPKRLSLKFKHLREQHLGECTVCHINITREKSVLALKPDVPITSCSSSSCHGARPDRNVITIETEVDQRVRDAGFVCSKCHTSDVGKRPTPSSHPAALAQ